LQKDSKAGINRILDANINRAKEGLRVCEEITRFLLDDEALTKEFKLVRHRIDGLTKRLPLPRAALIMMRQSQKDVGRKIYAGELKRKDTGDIFFSNIQRVKESLRVLEEFAKLFEKKLAVKFKELRYGIYEIEKKAARRLSALCNH
jgi:thiamine-phosphate pyrophosphorylase